MVESIGKRLKKLRIENGYTQNQIAEYLELKQNDISKLEHNMKKLKASDVTSWLEQQGYLSEIEYRDGSYCRELTEKSQEIGLILIEKQNQYGNKYNVILYGRNAQEFIINHLSDICEFVIKK